MPNRFLPSGLLLLHATSFSAPIANPSVVADLASATYTGRGVGTPGIDLARDYLENKLKKMNLEPLFPEHSYTQAAPYVSGNGVDPKREAGTVHNVGAVLSGKDKKLSNEYIVIGAHYDHLGLGYFGADDNASGVQAVLDLAELLRQAGKNRRPLAFVFFSGKEIGLVGSRHFTENPPLPQGARVVAMLDFDGVGRLQENKLTIMGLESGHEFPTLLENTRRRTSLKLVIHEKAYGGSDHASFLEKKIPALFFTTGTHEDYHRATDTPDKINFDGIRAIVDYAARIVQRLDSFEVAPIYNQKFAVSPQDAQPGRD